MVLGNMNVAVGNSSSVLGGIGKPGWQQPITRLGTRAPDGSKVALVVFPPLTPSQGAKPGRDRCVRPGNGRADAVAGRPAQLAGGHPMLRYRGAMEGDTNVSLGSDASARYLLLAGRRNGWIDHGRPRLPPPQGGAASTD